MATGNLHRILREIEALSAAERRELLEWLRANAGDAHDEAERERAFQERMLREGVLTRVAGEGAEGEVEPLVVRGKPASETLVEDREPR